MNLVFFRHDFKTYTMRAKKAQINADNLRVCNSN